MNVQYLFAYGTLMPARAPAELRDIVSRFRRIGRGFVRGRLYDLGEYPGAVLGEGPALLHGEVYEFPADEQMLRMLDQYEGFKPDDPGGSVFVRAKTPIKLETGKELNCWIYVYNRDPGPAKLISSGDYLQVKATGD